MQCLGGSPSHCTSQHWPPPALHKLSFENFVKSMTPSLSELKVTPSFCFAFKIPDDVAASNEYTYGKKMTGNGRNIVIYQYLSFPIRLYFYTHYKVNLHRSKFIFLMLAIESILLVRISLQSPPLVNEREIKEV